MFFKTSLFLVFILVFGYNSVQAITDLPVSSEIVYGEITKVDPDRSQVEVLTEESVRVLRVDMETILYRNHQLVSIHGLRPIAPGVYQEGLFIIDSAGKVTQAFVHYCVFETADGLMRKDMFGNVELIEER